MYSMMNANSLAAQAHQNTAPPSLLLLLLPFTSQLECSAASTVRQRTAVNHSTVEQNTPLPAGKKCAKVVQKVDHFKGSVRKKWRSSGEAALTSWLGV